MSSRIRKKKTEDELPLRTRGGHIPTGTSATRRARASVGATAKGERTKADLIRSGRVVFERMGYVEARVKDIVDEAGIAHGSFYTYFPSKREVFQEVMQEVGRKITAAVSHNVEDDAGDTLSNLEHANRRYIEVHRAHSKLMALYEQVATMDPVIASFRIDGRRRHVERVTKTITRLQERGVADPSLNAAVTAGALVAMLGSYASWSTMPGMKVDIATASETVTSIWARSIGLRSEA